MSHDENMRNAAHIYDNLTPEDFGAPSDGHCDRCDTSTDWDDLRHVDDLDLYECKGCIAHGDRDAVGETWRRTCDDCGDVFGALLVPLLGFGARCWACRGAHSEEVQAAAKKILAEIADDKRDGAVTALDRLPPFFGLELLIERIEGEPSGWSKQMRRGLEIEARETDSLTSTPARRAVYAALLALPWGTDHE